MPNGSAVVVSSSLFMRIMLRQVLGTLNLEVAVASNLKEATECLARVAPDIVLMDLADVSVKEVGMPRLAKNCNPSCAVIGLVPAQHERPKVVVAMMRAGMDGYIRAPISAEQISSRIQQSLRKSP